LRDQYPDWWNSPVPAFGDPRAWLAIVGLAPGLRGANRTGRAFTGDQSGDLLFRTLRRFGFSNARYQGHADDGLALRGCMIVNAVKCLPPGNRPLPSEIGSCRQYLQAAIAGLPRIKVLVALGRIAHESTLRALGERPSGWRFGHLAEHRLPSGLVVVDSYHCSRYNQNTGRLTSSMFEAVFERAVQISSTSRP
jgi:uracil-DNA glycosylase family 4